MKESYEVYVDEAKICTFRDRDLAHDYVKTQHKVLLPFLEYEPIGMGNLEVWQNAMIRIEIRRSIKGKFDVTKLIKNHIKATSKTEDSNDVVIVGKERKGEVNTVSAMPCTPRRTKIYVKGKKTESAVDGKIINRKGQQFIGKKGKDGKVRWAKYYEKNYETIGGVKEKTTGSSKRQAPKDPAKNFKEGIRKKGLNGKFWMAKKQANGKMKWFKV